MKNPFKSDIVKMIIMLLTCVSLIVIIFLHSFGIITEFIRDVSMLCVILILFGFLIYGIKEFHNFKDKNEWFFKRRSFALLLFYLYIIKMQITTKYQ